MVHLYRIIVIVLLIVLCVLILSTSYNSKRDLIKVCPTDAISMVNGKAVIDPIKCIGCGRCAFGIPNPLKKQVKVEIEPIETKEIPRSDSINSSLMNEAKPFAVKKDVVDKGTKTLETYSVDSELCISCRLCINSCPVNAISMKDGKAVIDQTTCISCGICFNGNNIDYTGCPVNAIKQTKSTHP